MGINQQDGPAVVGLDILAVDDEPVITRILQALLSKVGHRVTISGGGDHARELLKTRRFDLLITDKNMPDLSGLELSRLARASHPSIIIIMITAFSNRESASELRQLGADDYLEKPLDFEALIARIEELRQRRRSSPTPAPVAVPRVALVALPSPGLERLAALIEKAGGIPAGFDDVAAALAAVPVVHVLLVAARLITRDTNRAIWRTRVERPGLGVVLLSNGGLADEMAGISVGTRVLLSPTMDDAPTLELLRSALRLDEGERRSPKP